MACEGTIRPLAKLSLFILLNFFDVFYGASGTLGNTAFNVKSNPFSTVVVLVQPLGWRGELHLKL